LDTKREIARLRLQTMAAVGREKWEDLKPAIDGAVSDLESAVSNATSKFD
jgi:hypothetical protein